MSNEIENQSVDVETTDTAPKKHGKLGIVAVAVVALVLLIANAPKIANAAVKLFTSPAGYFQHVLGKSADDAAEQIAKGYGMVLEGLNESDDLSSDAKFTVSVGEDVIDMLEDETEMDFGWLESMSLLVNSDMTKDAYKFDIGLDVNEDRLISMVMLANMSDKMAYFQVPELNEDYLGLDLEMLFDEMDLEMDEIEDVNESLDKIMKALPKEAKVEKILKRYLDLAISCVEDVEQDKEEVKVGEITDKLTVLEATIDEKTLVAMMEKIIPELKEDKDIEKIMFDVLDTVGEVFDIEDDLDADEIYDDFIDGLDDLEDSLDDLEDEEFEFVLKLYVNNEGKIMGWAVEVEEADAEISSLLVTKGNKFAYELEGNVSGAKAVLEGSGKMSATKLNGDFKVKVLGMKMLEFTMTDLKLKDLKDGYFNGTVSVSLGKGAVSAIEDENGDELPFDVEDFVLELTGKNSKKKSDMTVSLYEKDELLVAVTVANEIGKAGKIKSPKDSEVIMAEDEEELMEWVQDFDVDEFVESLEDIFGEEMIETFEELLSGSGTADDYYYDDDYYYEDDWY